MANKTTTFEIEYRVNLHPVAVVYEAGNIIALVYNDVVFCKNGVDERFVKNLLEEAEPIDDYAILEVQNGTN